MKSKHKNLRAQTNKSSEQPTSQSNLPAPTPEQIQQRAHEIFEARGGAPGHDLDNWLQAEAALKAEIRRPRGNPAG